LLHDHGFRHVECKRMWLDSFYISLLSEQYRGSSRLTAFPLALLMGTWSNLHSLLSGRSTSSTLFIAQGA
jgi:hypothetical protein